MKSKIIWKLLGMYVLLVLVAVFSLNFFVGLKLKDYYELKISERLISNAILIEDVLQDALYKENKIFIQDKIEEYAKKLNLRITVIDDNGFVMGESDTDPEELDNHMDRLEVKRAIESGTGESNRFSDTLGYSMKYVAVASKKGDLSIGVIRIAMPMKSIEEQIMFIYKIILIGGIIAITIMFIIGYFMSKSIERPINEMKQIAQRISSADFSKRVKIKRKDELGVLAGLLNKMADELQSKIENLNKIDRMKTDFVANVSHELKTPLTSIKGFIETLEDGALEDEENARRFLSIIKKHTERLDSIISDLLSLSELEFIKEKLNKKTFDLRKLLDEVMLSFGHVISVKKHKVDVKIEGYNFKINADKSKIEQILVNIIDNAMKYTEPGGRIEICFFEKKTNVEISVKDTGIGIPKDQLDRIFERFYRVDKARSRQSGGTGLGLSIVKHIVSLHKGTIDIDSIENSGTKVIVSIPKG